MSNAFHKTADLSKCSVEGYEEGKKQPTFISSTLRKWQNLQLLEQEHMMGMNLGGPLNTPPPYIAKMTVIPDEKI